MSSKHTKSGWYQECRTHPRPPAPPMPYKEDDPAWQACDDWDDSHFYAGDDVLTCEDNRIKDICRECTAARQYQEFDDESHVVWHGSNTARDARGRFVSSTA